MRLIPELFLTLLWSTAVGLTALFLVARMLRVGLGVAPADLRGALRAPGIWRALLANLIAVPALAAVLVTVLPLSADTRLAILLLGVLPGGMDFSVARPSTARGPIAALVFLLSLATVVIAPALRFLLQPVGPPMAASVGRLALVSLLGLLVPLLAGLAIRAAAPGVAAVLARITVVLSGALLVAVLLSVVVSHGQPTTLGVVDALALVLFAVGAAAVGWLAGGPATVAKRQLARVTALRNVGLSLLIALVAVPHGGVALAVVAFVLALVVLRVAVAVVDAARRRRVGVDHVVPSA